MTKQVTSRATHGEVYWNFSGQGLSVHNSTSPEKVENYTVSNPDAFVSKLEEAKSATGYGPMFGRPYLIEWAVENGLEIQ